MDSLRKRVSRLSTITKSGLTSNHPDEEPKNDSLGSKMSNLTRRLTQQARGRFGKNEHAADDSEYLERKRRIKEIRKFYSALEKHMTKYLDSMRAVSFASSQVAEDLNKLYGQPECPVEYRHSSGTAVAKLHALDEETRKAMDEQFVNQVIEPLKAINRHFEHQHKEMKHREYLKLDYDAHRHTVAKLKEKGHSDASKLHAKEAARDKAEKVLQEATEKLYHDFDLVEGKRFSVAVPQINKFFELQRQFFQQGSRSFEQMPNLPTGVAPVSTPGGIAGMLDSSENGSNGSHRSRGEGSASATSREDSSTSTSMSPANAHVTQPVNRPSPSTVPHGSNSTAPAQGTEIRKVLFAHKPREADELELIPGETVTITQRHDDGWAQGRDARGKVGVFPLNHVEGQ